MDLTKRESHFEFGQNWADFARSIDDKRVSLAVQSLERLLPDGLPGKRVLDIGCGSGLSAVAALRLGAAFVDACDIDEYSVATAERVLSAFAGPGRYRVRQRSVFELSPSVDGLFDVVHSWGVLHHTGDMARAIRAAASLVAPGGVMVIAIYHKTLACRAWALEKRLYSRAPRFVQRLAQLGFAACKLPVESALARQTPATFIRAYHEKRGMHYWNDLHDWLGGYPYESASPAEVDALVGDRFVRERAFLVSSRLGLFGAGCNELVYQRTA